MNEITLDLKEQKRADRFERVLFQMFKENFRYLIRTYKLMVLPVKMFSEDQSNYLFDAFEVERSADGRYLYIREKS